MLAPPSKEHLPAHSRDVCPWGDSCKSCWTPRLAKSAKLGRPLKECFKCGGPRTSNLQGAVRGLTRPLCASCKEENRKSDFCGRPPLWLSRNYRQRVAA